MNEYHYSKLNTREQAYYKAILNAVFKGDYTVRFPLLDDIDKISKIALAINYDHPELFYVNFKRLNIYSNPLGTNLQISYNVKFSVKCNIIDEILNP